MGSSRALPMASRLSSECATPSPRNANVAAFAVLLALAAQPLLAQQVSLGVSAGETVAYFRYQIGRRITYVCPPVSPPADVVVWGTDTYSYTSAVCVAAIHAGVLRPQQAGVVTLTIGPGAASFAGSARNGVTTGDYAADDTSFMFDRNAEPGRIDGMTTTHFPAGFADSVALRCPALGTFPQQLSGTDIYADDSSICAAAVHVGLMTLTDGGVILVTPDGEHGSFTGSVRNGVTSQDYNSGAVSFRVAEVGAGNFVPKAAQSGTLAPTLTGANNPVVTAQVAKIDPALAAPVAVPTGVARAGALSPVASAPASQPKVVALENGPAPTGLTVTATPTTATVQWQPVDGATGYQVNRAPIGTTNWVAVTAVPITATTSPVDVLPGVGQAYTYQVAAFQSNGQRGAATVDFTAPQPSDPEGLTGTLVAPAEVQLSWRAVAGVNSYLVSGPGVPPGQFVQDTAFTLPTAPSGFNVYRVASSYSPGGVITVATAWPGVRVVVPPVPQVARLTLLNGAGSLAEYNRHACAAGKWVASQLVFPNNWCDLPGPTSVAQIQLYPLLNLFDVQVNRDIENQWAPADQYSTYHSGQWNFWAVAPFTHDFMQAEFTDTADLDRRRSVGCVTRGQAPNDATFCWALSAYAVNSYGETPETLSVIVQEPAGDYFLVLKDLGPYTVDPALRNTMAGLEHVTLDSQGPRFLPHTCLSCHGGQFDPGTGRVKGATLLPLDPRSFGPDPQRLQSVNSVIYKASRTAPGVRALLDTLYQGRLAVSEDVDLTAVPRGWSSQAELYLTVFRPHCASCHNTMSDTLAFQSWNDVVLEKVRVRQAICTGTMPHAEVPFWRFWTGGGAISWPGLLLTALGYNDGC